MNQSQLLYRLQLLDNEFDEANKGLAEIAAVLGESEALDRAKKAVEAVEKDLRQAQATMLDLDLEVKSLTDKIARQEKTLYSGAVTSAKEAANLQDEVASLKRWQEKREELLLEAMVEVEELEGDLNQAQAEMSTIQAQWAADQEDLSQKQARLKEKVAELMAQRPSIVSEIDEDDLRDYEALRPKKGGRAVTVLKNGVCQGCGMAASNSEILRARAGTELTFCNTCGRILYVL